MKTTRKKDSEDIWDNRELGASEKHVRKAPPQREKSLDDRLGLQVISIRLPKSLINHLKRLADKDAMGYQPYLRQILMRHVREIEHERKRMLSKKEKHMLAR